MTIKPIRTEQDYQDALDKIESLMNQVLPGTPEGDVLEILVALVREHEGRQYRIQPGNPRDIVLFMLDQRGLRQSDLAIMMGSRSRASEFLSGQRSLSLGMIRKLSSSLRIPTDLLIGTQEDSGVSQVAESRKRYGDSSS